MQRRRWIGVSIAILAALLLLGRAAAHVYTEYLWYSAIGAGDVWRLRTFSTTAQRLLGLVVWSGFIFLNLYAVRRSVVSIRIPRRLGNLEIGEEFPGRYLDLAALLLALTLGALIAWAQTDWMRGTLAFNGLPFGEIDPYFERDLGFFVYWMPFERLLRDTAFLAVLITGFVVVALYALTPSLARTGGKLYVSNYVRRHLFVLLALMLIILSWSFRIDAYDALLEGSGPAGLYTAADQHAVIPVNSVLTILAISAAALTLWTGWTGQVRVALTTVGILIVVSVGARQLAPALVARNGDGSSATTERAYEQIRATYTRRAFGVSNLVPDSASAIPGEIGTSTSNLSSWDPAAITRAAARATSGIPHGVGWRAGSDGLLAIVPVAPAGESPTARRWIAAELEAAAAAGRGDMTVHRGQSSNGESASIAPPRVLDGASGYLLVSEREGQVEAPAMSTLFARLAFAWSEQHYGLLSSAPGTRVMLHRDAREIVRRMVPFFRQGTTLFPVIDRDTLYWVVDLYSASRDYPLSHTIHLGDRAARYVRRAATALVNATTGRVQLIASDSLDPLALSWLRLVPSMVSEWSDVSPTLAASLPPAIDEARMAAAAVAEAGSRGEDVTRGRLPPRDASDPELESSSPALYLRTGPGGEQRLAWTVPVLDAASRAIGAVTATGGRERRTILTRLPSPGPRWGAVMQSLRNAADSAAVTPRDTRLVRGPVRTSVQNGHLIYSQSVYAWRGEAAPSLLAVSAVADAPPATAGRTTAEALGESGQSASEHPALEKEELIDRIRELYDQMDSALARGDLTAFGAIYDTLGQLLGRTPR